MAVRKGIAVWAQDRACRFSARAVETLTGARTITLAEVEQYQIFLFDPGGASRTVTLPAEEACKGVVVMISNRADAAEVLTIENDAASTVVTPTQAEAAMLFCDGVSWCGLVGAQS